MDRFFGTSSREEEGEWLSVSDLMAGLMVIFLFIAIVFIRPLAEQNLEIKEIARTWQENELEIYKALLDEFEEDLPRCEKSPKICIITSSFPTPTVLIILLLLQTTSPTPAQLKNSWGGNCHLEAKLSVFFVVNSPEFHPTCLASASARWMLVP